MKTLLFITAILLGALTAQAAPKPLLVAEDLMPKLIDDGQFEGKKIQSATAIISKSSKIITLKIQPAWSCKPNLMCPAVMPKTIDVELPLTSVKKSFCGSVVYTAKKDDRPVDGYLRAITVFDNTKFYSFCKSLIAVEPVTVSYQTAGYNRLETHEFNFVSTFVGKSLKKVMPAIDPYLPFQ